MAEKNQEIVLQGETVVLDIYFYNNIGTILTDPDTTPTYEIFDPDGTSMATGIGTKISTGYYSASYDVDENAVISTLWKIVWTAQINGMTVADAFEYFIVTADESIVSDITISTTWLNHIKKRLGYPSVNNIILSNTDIKELIVKQALYEYFIKFPKISEESSYSVGSGGEVIIDFPDSYTFGCLDIRTVGKGYKNIYGASFWDLILYNSVNVTSTGNRNMYGSTIKGYNPNFLRQTRYLLKNASETAINQGTFKYRINQDLKKVYVYSSISATLNIQWAKYSNDFSDVRFQFIWDVIKLCQGYFKLHMADTFSLISDSTAELNVDVEKLKEDGDKLLEEIRDKWLEYPTIIVERQ